MCNTLLSHLPRIEIHRHRRECSWIWRFYRLPALRFDEAQGSIIYFFFALSYVQIKLLLLPKEPQILLPFRAAFRVVLLVGLPVEKPSEFGLDLLPACYHHY